MWSSEAGRDSRLSLQPAPSLLCIFLQVPLSSGEDSPSHLTTWAGSETPESTWRELSRLEGAGGCLERARRVA